MPSQPSPGTLTGSLGRPPRRPIRVQARARYHQPEQDATAFVLPDGRVQVTFDRPQRALTKGQAIVLYQADVVIGGGTIEEIQET